MTLNQQQMKGFSVGGSTAAEANAAFVKVKQSFDYSAERSKASGATISIPIAVPPGRRPYVYWAMPTRTTTITMYEVAPDCTIRRALGARTATWLTGNKALPYSGLLTG